MPWGLIILLAVGLAIGWLLLVLYTVRILTHPPRRSYAFAVARNLPGDPSELVITRPGGASQRGLPFTSWTFTARAGELPVWDVAGLDPDGPTIIITHGWGDSRVMMLPRLAALAPYGSRIILWDLPAHGDAPRAGFSLGAHEYLDLLALYEHVLASHAGPKPQRVFLHGFSLGAGVSIQAAALLPVWKTRGLQPPAGVIAEAPYRVPITPARNVLRMRGLPHRSNIAPAIALLTLRFGHWFQPRHFDRAKLPPQVPLLLLHGALDPICPPQDSRDIAARNPGSTLHEIPGAAHANLWTDPVFAEQATDAVVDFIGSPHAAPGTLH